MRPLLRTLALVALVGGFAGLTGCDSVGGETIPFTPDTGTANTSVTTQAGVTPRLVSGNLAGDANTVCKLEVVAGAGNGWWGRKVDPPRAGTHRIDGFDITIRADLKTLSFATMSPDVVRMRHIVVKGGPDTFVYDYDGSVLEDAGLVAPPNRGGNVPQISHYTICYDLL